MEAEELMTGDWVRISLAETNSESHKGKFAKVTELKSYPNWNSIKVTTGGLDEYYCERDDEIEPIPLTSEILEKNGFDEWDGWRIFDIEDIGVEIGWCGTILEIGGECGDLELPSVMYVHQLQHALRLCGIEKQIEL